MNYWVFKTNPEVYDIDARLRKADEPRWCWPIPPRHRSAVAAGDVAFVWKTSGKSSRRHDEAGIVAMVRVTRGTAEQVDLPWELEFYAPEARSKGTDQKWRVLADITRGVGLISRRELGEVAPEIAYEELFAESGARDTVIRLAPKKGELLEKWVLKHGKPLPGWSVR